MSNHKKKNSKKNKSTKAFEFVPKTTFQLESHYITPPQKTKVPYHKVSTLTIEEAPYQCLSTESKTASSSSNLESPIAQPIYYHHAKELQGQLILHYQGQSISVNKLRKKSNNLCTYAMSEYTHCPKVQEIPIPSFLALNK